MVIKSEFFKSNRLELLNKLPDNTAALIFAGEEKSLSQDSEYPFLPDRNFYYLTGLSVPKFILMLTKISGVTSEKLYIEPKDDYIERWHGKKISKEEASAISGVSVEDIEYINDFEESGFFHAKHPDIAVAFDGASIMDAPRTFRHSIAGITDKIIDIKDILTSMRLIKKPEEIEAIEDAARITEEALDEMKKYIKPGVSEYELHTILEYEMVKRGSRIHAFPTIVSVGDNTFYLHHSTPEEDKIVTEGCQIQIDVGARSAGLCADISRVYFVGKPEADDNRVKLHGLIKALRKRAFEFIAPGQTIATLNSQMHKITADWLIANGLISEEYTLEDVKKYYWHNTSHFLGLDVHDTGNREKKFEPGICLAVEPGVYIPEWGVGFRIEDDVLVTVDGCRLLSSGNDDLEGIVIE